MSKLIRSSQSCSYQFDNKGRHITTAMCTERHIYLPFSHRWVLVWEHIYCLCLIVCSVVPHPPICLTERMEYLLWWPRISAFRAWKGSITGYLVSDNFSTWLINTPGDMMSYFLWRKATLMWNVHTDVDRSQAKPLHFEDPEDKAPVQTKDAVLSTLRELAALAGTEQGRARTSLFHKLVSSMRVLRNETLSQTVAEMVGVSSWLTFQALFQCGTSECTSAIMQIIWTIDGVALEVDALVYGLSLQANPDAARVRDMLSMAQYKQSKAIMYALANTVKKWVKKSKEWLKEGKTFKSSFFISFTETNNLFLVMILGQRTFASIFSCRGAQDTLNMQPNSNQLQSNSFNC